MLELVRRDRQSEVVGVAAHRVLAQRAGLRRAAEEGRQHEVPTAHLAKSNVMALEKVIAPREVYERDVAWIRACDALIAEVSVPSHGVGYEIGFALGQGKPVLCLAQSGVTVSKMITGNSHSGLQVKTYRDVTEGINFIREFLSCVICE